MYCLHPNGEKLPADTEVIQKYDYQVGDITPFTGLLICLDKSQEEVEMTTETPAY